jgi:hypothetical protein
MAVLADSLPDDAGRLKAMLIAERIQNERLRQIIKELQRHRFGRRTETLPEDQMLLGLEEVEQVAASNEAQIQTANPAEQASRATKRRMNRGSLPAHRPRIEMWSTSKAILARAVAMPCIGSARIPANVSTSCRRSSECSSSADPNMAAAVARTWLCRRPRRRG